MQQFDSAINNKELTQFRKYLRILEREISQAIKSESDCCGVSFAQCHVLLELEETGPVSLNELKDRLILDKSTVSRTVDKLVNDGYVIRTENPEDRRFNTLELSKNGQQRALTINTHCNDRYAMLFSDISPQEQELLVKTAELLAQKMGDLRNHCGTDCCNEGNS